MQQEQIILTGNQLRNSVAMNIQSFEEDYPQEVQSIQQWDQLFMQGESSSSELALIEAGELLRADLAHWSITFDDAKKSVNLISHWAEMIATTNAS